MGKGGVRGGGGLATPLWMRGGVRSGDPPHHSAFLNLPGVRPKSGSGSQLFKITYQLLFVCRMLIIQFETGCELGNGTGDQTLSQHARSRGRMHAIVDWNNLHQSYLSVNFMHVVVYEKSAQNNALLSFLNEGIKNLQ